MEEIEELKQEISRLRTLVLILARNRLEELQAAATSQFQVTDESDLDEELGTVSDYLGEALDIVRVDEDEYQRSIMQSGEQTQVRAPRVNVPTLFEEAHGIGREVTMLDNLQERLLKVIEPFENTLLTPSTGHALQQAVYAVMNSLTHTLGLTPDFWHIEVEPDLEKRSVTIAVAPKILQPHMHRIQVTQEEGEEGILFIATMTIPGIESDFIARGSVEMEALIHLAQIFEIQCHLTLEQIQQIEREQVEVVLEGETKKENLH